jgi:tellurite resistance protein TerC
MELPFAAKAFTSPAARDSISCVHVEKSLEFWIGFNAVVVALLILDLTVLHRTKRAISLAESLITTLGWISLAALFGGWVIYEEGNAKGYEFLTGYLIEYSLSVDNIFIFVLVFASFQVAADQQHRLLFWGVLGALVMRGIMILAGSALLTRFEWLIYVFGAYILYAGVQMLRHKTETDIEKMKIVQLVRRWLPISTGPHGGRFFVRENGRLKFTMLFLTLIVIELTDLIFALDSIPAIFGVTTDPFIIYTSNVCAILGLRSLYFLLASAISSLVYLRIGLAFVLMFIGGKMVLGSVYHVDTEISLAVIGTILAVAIIASVVKARSMKQGRI